MKTQVRYIRRRSRSSSHEGNFFKKENSSEQKLAGDSIGNTFFNPAKASIQRAPAKAEEEKKLQPAPEKKEEDKKAQRKSEEKKEEEKIPKPAPEKKEEEDKKLKRKASSGQSTGAHRTSNYVNSLSSSGSPLPAAAQVFFSQRMGYDFSHVKIHTGSEAEQSAADINALAYAYKDHIVFNKGQYDPESAEGKKLLAHELTHVVQNSPNIKRKVSSNYSDIDDYLSRGFFDWAITDADTYRVISTFYTIQSSESKRNFYDTIKHMHSDGNLSTFFDQVPSDAESGHVSLLSLVRRIRDNKLSKEEMLEYQQSLAWVTNAAEALDAVAVINGMLPKDRFMSLSAVNRTEFDTFLSLIPETDDPKILKAIQNFTILNQGTNIALLGAYTRLHLVVQAYMKGLTLEEFLAGEASGRGYGSAPATKWSRTSTAQKKRWKKRFDKVYTDLKTKASPEIIAMLNRAILKGGGIKFDEEACERNGAFAFSNGTNWLTVGIHFVQAAEKNLNLVYANISHEIGHDDYGNEQISEVMDEALTPAEQAAANASGNSLYSAYGYLESEIYAELREHKYVIIGKNPTDDPDSDVEENLKQILVSMGAVVSGPLLIAFRNRISRDVNISASARSLFDTKLKLVFPGLI